MQRGERERHSARSAKHLLECFLADPSAREHCGIAWKENRLERRLAMELLCRSDCSYTCSLISMDSTTTLGQEEIVPLTGNPYFSCIISPSHIKHQYQMTLPRKFRSLLPLAVVPVVLNCQGKSWEMLYYGDRALNRFDTSWRKFAADNNLVVGDALVFELMDGKKVEFKVQILKGRIPPAVGDPDGCSRATPIVID